MKPKVKIDDGIDVMLKNINDWKRLSMDSKKNKNKNKNGLSI